MNKLKLTLISIISLIIGGCAVFMFPQPSEEVENETAFKIGYQTTESYLLTEDMLGRDIKQGAEIAYSILVDLTGEDGDVGNLRTKLLNELDRLLTEEEFETKQKMIILRYAEAILIRVEDKVDQTLTFGILNSMRVGTQDALRAYGVIDQTAIISVEIQ